ncbi:MAG: lipopolysaccharide export system protein LptC [Alteromonas macleodii]|jgi:lipopolysaccharide export system protein LptC
MESDDNLYSQFVGFLKIILPLAALALMSTVFLLARSPTQESSIPQAEIEEIAREPRLSGARVSGVTEDGSVIEITAQTARPNGNNWLVETIYASIDAVDGVHIDIRAGQGEINNTTRIARLTGLARVETSDGYEMETAGIITNLTTGRIVSDGALEIQAPFGFLTAGEMIIETPIGGNGQVMLFQNGVRLVYTP